MAVTTLTTLPPEILISICEYVSRSDLRNLRYIAAGIQYAAEIILFRTIFLKLNLDSFERLQDVANHPEFCKYVETIYCDGRTFTNLAPENLGLTREEFIAQYTNQQLNVFYHEYLRLVFGQEFLLRRDNDKTILMQALPKFSNLSRIQYSVLEEGRTRTSLPAICDLSPLAQKVLVEPMSLPAYLKSHLHFWTLLQSAYLSGHAEQLNNVSGSDLQLERWDDAAASYRHYYRALPSLHHLSPGFRGGDHIRRYAANLADLIAHSAALRSFHISFDYLPFEDLSGATRLSDIISERQQWNHITSLSLQAIVTTEAELRNLLKRHASAMRLLKLSHITFFDGDGNDEEHGSWIKFIEFLGTSMSLEYVGFQGNLSNAWDEAWVVDPDDEDQPGGSFCIPRHFSHNCYRTLHN